MPSRHTGSSLGQYLKELLEDIKKSKLKEIHEYQHNISILQECLISSEGRTLRIYQLFPMEPKVRLTNLYPSCIHSSRLNNYVGERLIPQTENCRRQENKSKKCLVRFLPGCEQKKRSKAIFPISPRASRYIFFTIIS